MVKSQKVEMKILTASPLFKGGRIHLLSFQPVTDETFVRIMYFYMLVLWLAFVIRTRLPAAAASNRKMGRVDESRWQLI